MNPQELPRVELGNEIFIKNFPSELEGKRLGLIINQTSFLPQGKPLLQALLELQKKVTAIFSPEHGYSGEIEGGKLVEDVLKGDIKIYSLYGKTKRPSSEQMKEIDAFIYDIQDVGTRFYTYITTLKYVLEAAAQARIPVYVLDRPNPCGGVIVEGPLLAPEYESFIGALPIPIRYGLTVGELAMMMKGEGWVAKEVELHIYKMNNWQRHFFWKNTGLKWIPPSPNMPSPKTAIIYPGTGLLGALRINPGLGTLNPFLQLGAPWLKTETLLKKLNQGKSYGIELEPIDYTPRSLLGKTLHPPYENRLCHGIKVIIKEEEKFYALKFVLDLINILHELNQKEILPYSNQLNLMFGKKHLADFLEGKIEFDSLKKEIEKDEKIFQKKRAPYLLY